MPQSHDAEARSAPRRKSSLNTLIVGASGFNGRTLSHRLQMNRHRVRGLVRDVANAPISLDDIVQGDVITGEGLTQALTGVDVAYYFVHSLDPGDGSTDERDLRAAHTFAKAAAAAGLPRLVYLTTLAPPAGATPPAYQRNRLAVESIFIEHINDAIILRSPLVLGSGSRALRPYLRLVQRVPMIPMGPWRYNRIAVVDAAAVAEFLLAAATAPESAAGSWDIPASAQPTHLQFIQHIAHTLGLRRFTLGTPVANAALDARLMAAITGESYQFCRTFITANQLDYIVDPTRQVRFTNVAPQPLTTALQAAILNWNDLPRYHQRPK
ncbi:NAD(P)H-binding protein (plasmid) [Mycolicibacterium farcinogenes]|uniref:NAD(P)H-binding protein n=2 Tax=Mycolicibacterium farcinogenes TaxID=1802 RepID=A0ACD1FQT4_MYCFR|nr:NAD(P)H-binding protein [Mycolicibacterium farcinogenes]QZH69403.1 NAD(P)H-binding protein [Mycolicibacterium farcinogenes]